MCREQLHLERVAIFIRDGDFLKGTYGTDRDGKTTDEHAHRFETGKKWLARLHELRSQQKSMVIPDQEYHEWKDGRSVVFGRGWVAVTPIQTSGEFLGVLCNDTAISGAPLDEGRQEIVTVLCSTLGALIEQKRAEDVLRQSRDELEWRVCERTEELVQLNDSLILTERRQKAILDNIPDMAWLKDAESRFIAVNQPVANMAGAPIEEIPGKTDLDFYPRDLAERYRADDREVMRLKSRKMVEEPIEDPTGRRIWIETIKTPIFNYRGDVIGTAGIARDISERRKQGELLGRLVAERTQDLASANVVLQNEIAERRRAATEIRRLAMVVQQAAESVVISDTDGNILYVNPAFEHMTGYTQDEVLGKNPRMLKSGKQDDDFYRRMWETLTGGGVWAGHLTNRRKDGTLYELEATISPIRDDQDRIVSYVSASRDVTRELQLEQQFRQAQKMEAIGRLAGGIAHDFNNLLTSILGYSRLIRDELGDGHPLSVDVDEVCRAGERAAALTKQLLAFSRKQMIQPQAISLNTVVMDMDKILRRTLGEDVELVTLLDDQMSYANADTGLFEQVIMNLAINARDAMPKGGSLTIQTQTVTIDDEYCSQHVDAKPGDYVLLSVRDNGEGMSDDVREHCFEPFYTTKETGKGTGLGLSIVYSVAKQFGGFLDIDTAPGRGTEVKVYLPVVRPPAGRAAPRAEADLPHGTETILVVEDEDTVRRLTVRMLESLGYHVLQARHGGEALLICERHKERIDLVLTDVVMPHIGGQDLVERLKVIRHDFKVVFMSGFTDEAFAHGTPDGHSASLILKPFTQETLAVRVRNMLDSRPKPA